ncbi:MAG: flagellar type III secretion system pore protein FliP [Acutalibacteraceae bacterium]|jgi:flagellar biosynthetic protein FliP
MAQTVKMQNKDDEKTVKAKKSASKISKIIATVVLILMLVPMSASAQGAVDVNINGDGMETVEIIVMLTMLALIPSILVLTTCFTRIIIVLSFLRNALGLQQTPPNQVLIGIAIFLSLFIMSPVIKEIDDTAYTPYKQEQISQDEFISKASVPLKTFMLKQTKTPDLNLFVEMSQTKDVENPEDLPITVIIPSFVTSELKRAFTIGFLLYIPFLIIDMIVSSTLMSMGMIMLPPATIAMPFKLLLFVLVDGWALLFKTLAVSFNL